MMRGPVLDLEVLLAPVSEAAPAGEDPRADTSPASLYYRVKDARVAGRAAERGSLDPDAESSDAWGSVLEAGETLLTSRAKDLEVAAWMTEALLRLEGFAGLRDGFLLIAGLVERYWDTVFPLPDEEDGLEPRISPVAGLNGSGATGTLAQPIQMRPLVGIARTFSIWSYDQTVDTDKLTDPARKEARIAAGTPSMQMFKDALAETPAADLQDTVAEVEEALAALAKMTAVLDAAAGYDAPSTTAIRDLLQRVAGSIRHFGGEKLASLPKAAVAAPGSGAAAPEPGSPAPAHAPAPASVAPAHGGPRAVGVYASREEALDDLMALAAYFRRTEPQAPISYTLDEAVRRARMTLTELLRELSQDEPNIYRFLLAAGIRYDGDKAITSLPERMPTLAAVPVAEPVATPAAPPVETAAAPPADDDGWSSPKHPPSSDGW